MEGTPLINGIRHSWANVRTNILGRTVQGISAISYEDKVEKANNYGAGQFPVSRGHGRYEASAKVTLKHYEVEAIHTAALMAGASRLQDIAPFDIVVSYLNPSDKIVTHVIRNCEFTNNKRELKEGDTNFETEFDLIVSHIEWGN